MGDSAPADAAGIWLAYNAAENAVDLDGMRALVQPRLRVLVNGRADVSSADDDLRAMQALRRAYPDYRREVEQVLSAGEHAVIRWRMRGTPAQGSLAEPLDVSGCSVVQCSEGAIESAHVYYDAAALGAVLAAAVARQDS